MEGFTGVDCSPQSDATVILDLRRTPWPWDDGSVAQVFSNHFLEHLTGLERMVFMDELWRVLAPGAVAVLITPYWTSMRAVQDPTHQWPPLCENSFHYFNRDWREQNGLSHYPLRCHFSFKFQLIKNAFDAVDDLRVVLTKEA